MEERNLMILRLVIWNHLPRDTRKPLILIEALVEYVEVDQEKKTNISKSTAPLLLKLGWDLDHIYFKTRKFLAPTRLCTIISSPE